MRPPRRSSRRRWRPRASRALKAPVELVTALDATVPYSEPMEQYLLPDEAKIVAAVQAAVGRPSPRSGLDRGPSSATGRLGGDVGLELLRSMWRIRVFEERVGELTRADEVHGLVHLSVGQEAVAVGVCGQLRPDDVVYSGHRAHGHAIAKGAPLGRRHGRAHGPGRRPLPRSGRLDAPRRRRARLHGCDGRRGWERPARTRQRAGGPAPRRRPGRGRLLRRRRRPGRHLRRVGQPRDAVGSAGDPRLREQRLRGVHAALRAHERRARQRRRGAVRRGAGDGRRQRRVAVRETFARFLAEARAGAGRCSSSA